MAKANIEVAEKLPEGKLEAGVSYVDLRSVSAEQKDYLRRAHSAYLQNPDYLDFDALWIGGLLGRIHEMEVALLYMWLALGINQEQVESRYDTTVYILI